MTSCERLRKVVVPVVYCDFLSMYPTVNALMQVGIGVDGDEGGANVIEPP
jgi:hypothetical protein